MSEQSYLPKREEELLEWLNNFSTHLPTLGAELGITPAEASSLSALILSVQSDIKNGNGQGEEKKLKKVEMLKFLTSLVGRMRKHPSYKENVHGKKLNIA